MKLLFKTKQKFFGHQTRHDNKPNACFYPMYEGSSFYLHHTLLWPLTLELSVRVYEGITLVLLQGICYYLFCALPFSLFSSVVCQCWPWAIRICQPWKAQANVTAPLPLHIPYKVACTLFFCTKQDFPNYSDSTPCPIKVGHVDF